MDPQEEKKILEAIKSLKEEVEGLKKALTDCDYERALYLKWYNEVRHENCLLRKELNK